ncbi:Peptidoglycan-binding Lysin subgroup [Penicillium antarcticum]|uniref:Peptidoglycan-binding Lysin subgroup n=1 Tax=Penicillium antarcticum TaxID=416450 RepID=UPI00238592E7|nr:Peptidoglycan-binding Lysin subgroup [Penicillium antarcticum]KAJ5301928.1 Peptidoglycan-binding Lysin subgroup [Penicillium antarcticum]
MKLIHSFSVLILFFISWAVALEQGNSDTFLSKSVHKCDAVLTATLDGICHIYTVQARDNYAVLATQYGITTTNIETWNTGVWGWTGCDGLKQGSFICLSSGNPPMPAAVPQAVCGPQVPCTARPISMSDLGSLNPCPSGECCSKLGKCGTSTKFCDTGCDSNCKETGTLAKKSASSETTSKPPSPTSKTSTKATNTTSKQH